jgi:hypothetical protein
MVKVTMKETRQASPDGVSTHTYDKGNTYEGATPHSRRVLESFVDRGFAEYFSEAIPETKKTKVTTPKKTKKIQ